MRLLIYSHFLAPSIGGVETIVLSLAQGLAELRDANGIREFEITVVTQTPAGNYDDSALSFRVVRQPSLWQLWRLIRKSEVVHAAGPALAPLVLSRLARKPFVIEHHGFQTICPNGQLLIESEGAPCPGHFMADRYGECLRCNSGQGWFVSWKLCCLTFVRRLLCAQASANITPTQWLAGLLKLPRVTAVPHGLDARPPIHRTAAPGDAPLIAFMGRLVTTKGVVLLLQAAKILRERKRCFELLIIGEGPERSALEQFIHGSPLAGQVRFMGRLDGNQLEAALAQVTAFVVPSLGGEVFGLVVAENMARGLPIVASDLGAFVEVLGDAGLCFRTGDAPHLAAVLTCLLDDPSTGDRLSRLAHERAIDFFSTGRMIEGHVRVYRAVRDAIKN